MARGPLSLRIEFDPEDRFYNKVMGYEHLISNSNYYAVAQIQRGLASIILGALERAIDISGIPSQYADHLRIGFSSVILPEINVSTNGSLLQASVPDIAQLGTVADLVHGFHYHALAANPATDGRKFSKTVVNKIELPYVGQEMYNEHRPERRQAFWEAILSGSVYTVNVVRRNRNKGGGTNSYSFTVSTAGLKDETFNARVATWGMRYPEWMLLEYGDDGPPAIRATHLRAMIETETLYFMEDAWQTQFQTLVDQWNRDNYTYTTPSYVQEEQEWSRFYSRHMDDVIDKHDYGYDVRGVGSKIRNLTTGRWS